MELFWNSLDNAPLSIVFYLEMKVEVEVGVHGSPLGCTLDIFIILQLRKVVS